MIVGPFRYFKTALTPGSDEPLDVTLKASRRILYGLILRR